MIRIVKLVNFNNCLKLGFKGMTESNYAIGIHQTCITLSGWLSHCIYSQTSHHAISQSFFVVLLFKITAIK